MKLKKVLENIRIIEMTGNPDIEIRGISSDSRKADEGFLFCAVRGENTDGHKYLDSAISNGAKALLVEEIPEEIKSNITYAVVENSMQSTPIAAANYYQNPSKEMRLIGITGTNGKTTTSYIMDSIWKEEGSRSGIIGTIEITYGDVNITASMTTPDSIELTRLLGNMRDNETDTVSMEVSSHALDRNRPDGCHFDVAVFTNLSQDHLDYHGSIENYYSSKKKLFTNLLNKSEKPGKLAVINADDQYGAKLVEETQCKTVTYSVKSKNCDIYPSDYELSASGIKAEIVTPKGNINLNSELIGEHNLYNILAAVGSATGLDTPLSIIESALSGKINVPGRLERIENGDGINVLVDYAHTHDALENVLSALAPFKKRKIITVFGCGGDRDRGKRPRMGKVSAAYSDFVIITSDNPRTEDPDEIIEEIEAGLKSINFNEKNYIKIKDRKEAIEYALDMADENDIVLLAGKGHEDYQIVGNKRFDFDDRQVASNYFKQNRVIQ